MLNNVLELVWTYGYRGQQCRNNLHYNANGDLVYFVAGVAIVHNIKSETQQFYHGHSDDITCLSLHSDKKTVASGQIGKEAFICIWNSEKIETISIIKQIEHDGGIGIVSFSGDGKYMLSVGLDDNSTLIVWDWKRAKEIARYSQTSERVLDAHFQPTNTSLIVCCGIRHIKFYSLSGNVLTPTLGQFKTSEPQTLLSIAFGEQQQIFSGSLNGDIFLWNQQELAGAIELAHSGGVFVIHQMEQGFATGGRDSVIKLWDTSFKPVSDLQLNTMPNYYPDLLIRAISSYEDQIVFGTHGSEIVRVSLRNRSSPEVIVNGHNQGELWALATHPKKQMFATGGDDQTLRLWDSSNHKLLQLMKIAACVRSCAFNHDGSTIAIGLSNGSLHILTTSELAEVATFHQHKRPLHELKFSPRSEYLAVGCNDGSLDVYHVTQHFKHIQSSTISKSFVTHFDWSKDSKFLQINTGAGERIILKMPLCKRTMAKDEISKIEWETWTCILGKEVSGIWPKYAKTGDINAIDVNFNKSVAVTGDDSGIVKVFEYPAEKKGAKFRKFLGHSAHVTNVRFSCDKQTLLTTGGADNAVFQWFLTEKDEASGPKSNDVTPSSDMSSSDDDNDMDSDIEKEKMTSNYKRFVSKDKAGKVMSKVIRRELKEAGQKRNSPPKASLSLEYVFGYRGYDGHNNIALTQDGQLVYYIAAVGIILNRETRHQRFYIGHTDDILCQAIHPIKDIVATGQVGRSPVIHVWSVETLEVISILAKQHTNGICCLGFSGDGKKLASVGLDENHEVILWDWKKGETLASTRGHKDKIFEIRFDPSDAAKLATVGVRHIKFWNHTGGGFTSKRGTFGKVAKMDTMLCICYGAQNECLTGTANGMVYMWIEETLIKAFQTHKGPVFAICSLNTSGYVTGGKDGKVNLWSEKFERCLKSYEVTSTNTENDHDILTEDHPVIRAVILGQGKVFAGTNCGEIMEITKEGKIKILTQGHREGEVWGLCTHSSKSIAVTVSDDNYLRIWNTNDKLMVNLKNLAKPARAVAISTDGTYVAVGYKDGSVTVSNASTFKLRFDAHHRKEEMSDIKFSPDDKYLAVASHDNFVDIYSIESKKRVGICRGASSYVTHVDWDKSGTLLQLNSGARELLYFEPPKGSRHALDEETTESIEWNEWTCVLGKTCDGIWPPNSDITDVNAAALNQAHHILATGDDFGFVKLFDYPSHGKFAKYKQYLGHSAHVTNVRWNHDRSKLLSVGGADTSLMLWKLTGDKEVAKGVQSDTSDTDSDEEGGFDSDVENEKNLKYVSKLLRKPIRDQEQSNYKTQAKVSSQKLISRESHKAIKVKRILPQTSKKAKPLEQIKGIELEYVFGYSGFDSNNNVKYLNQDGTEIVFHTAGTAVIHNLVSGQQRFYIEHTDDITAIAVNHNPKFNTIVASAQIEKAQPTIRIWDAKSLTTVSILQPLKCEGINCLHFSASGKHLISVGVDEGHRIRIWKWLEGTEIAAGDGHTKSIFDAKFRPDSDTEFVTVGIKHVKFWKICGAQLNGQRGVQPSSIASESESKTHTMLSIAFAPDNLTYTGSASGDVHVWKGNLLSKVIPRAHNGPIFSMHTSISDGLITTGGKDLKQSGSFCVKLWDQNMQRSKFFPFHLPNQEIQVVKAVDRCKDKIVIGTKSCDILEITESTGSVYFILNSHEEGKLSGLSVHPSNEIIATCSYDKTLRLWNLPKKIMLQKIVLSQEGTCCSFSPDGGLVAVGHLNGEVTIYHSADLTCWAKRRDRKSSVNEIRFSPDGKWLIAGFEEGLADLYDIAGGPQLSRKSYCKNAPNGITHLDFSENSEFVRVSTCSFDVLYFTLPGLNPVLDQSVIDQIIYDSWTDVCGDEVLGIWPEDSTSDHINTACLSHNGAVLATGDDSGLVKLFNFPCENKSAQFIQYEGHSAHVTNVRFTFDDRRLITIGGEDTSIFVWKCIGDK